MHGIRMARNEQQSIDW